MLISDGLEIPRSAINRRMNAWLFFYLFLLSLTCQAYTDDDGATPTPECSIVLERFQGLANGTTINDTPTGWTIDGVPPSAVFFAVKSNRFHTEDLGSEGIWRTKVFSVAAYSNFQVAVKVHAEGDHNSTEYVRIYYKINGGSETLLAERTGNFGTLDFISPELTGNTVQLIVKLYNYNNGGTQTSKYDIEEYRVFKEHGPCEGGAVSVTASANRTTLTCANPSATLSASSSASGVTYSWTGPNSFTSTSQNPSVSTAGTYTVTATNTSGSGTASVTLTENKTAPAVSATGGSLACASSVTLTASSSTSGVTYNWTGPNSFSSSSQNPTVSAAGTYTVTATNPSNGCTTSQSVTVTAASGTSTVWQEDFTASNGTTNDTGSTSWTIQNTSSGTFSVQSNEFKVSGIGTSTQGVWTSGTIDISGKTNVSVSVDTRSSGVAMNSSGTSLDYLRVFYKLNGGSEVQFADLLGNINNHSTTNSTVIASGLSGTSIQVIIRARATGSDEFYYFDNVRVSGTNQNLTATASASGQLTCSTTSVTLTGSASVTGATYSWTGPNSFTSTSQNPSVTAAGTYTVTASQGGCTATASVTVSENKTAPQVSATGGSLACASSVTLTASSTTSGVTYSWTGPNSFTSTSQNPSVNTAGTYTVTVRNPSNGCTSAQSVTVAAAGASSTFWQEDFSLSNGTTNDTGSTSWSVQNSSTGTFSVQSNEFKVSGTTETNQGIWTSGVIDIANKANVSIQVNTRSSGVPMNPDGTWRDYLRIYYKLNGSSSEVLFSEQVGSINSHSTTATTVSVGSLSGTSIQIVIKARATGEDEFYYFDNVRVSGTPIATSFTVSASASGTLTCTNSSATLTATGSISGLTYSWTGPNGFTSVQQNPVVTAAGVYTVTASQGTCAAVGSVTVSENKTAPQLTAAGGSIPCSSSLTLTASSSTSGVTYSWTGPNNFTSTSQNPSVTTPGTYTVTVRNTANGCTTSQSVVVNTSTGSSTPTDFWLEDFTFANGTTVDTGTTGWTLQNATGTFSVQNNEFKASFGSANEGVWLSDVVNISTKSDVVIGALLKSGTTSTNDFLEEDDYIRVYYKLNSGAEVLAYENFGGFNDNNNTTQSYNFASGPLNGTTLQIVIRVRNSNSTELYFFDNVKLNGRTSPLGLITTSVSGAISCTNTSVQLSASSTASGATYYWIHPNGSTINQQNPTVSDPGNYVVVVTASGCQSTQTVTVSGSRTQPDVSIIGDNFNCNGGASTVNLTAFSSVEGLTYAWTGPGTITNGNTATATTSTPGTHTVTVMNPVNACTNTASFTVGYTDGSTTAVWNETFDELSDGTTSENGATGWSTDNSRIHTVDLTGYSDETGTPYYQEVRGGNLSVKTTRGEVVWISQSIPITAHGQVQLMADITGEGSLNDETDCGDNCYDYDYVRLFYKLNGGPETPFTTNGNFAGKLALNGVIASTGIFAGNTVQIIIRSYNTGNNEIFHLDNIRVLKVVSGSGGTVSASVSGPITCTSPTATLSATPVIPGATYTWAGPGGATYTGASVNVSVGGSYTVTVTGSGCASGATASVTVTEDKATPTIAVNTPEVLTCTRTSVTLTVASSPSAGMTYLWTRPDGSTASTASISATAPGNYTVKVTNPVNGCFATTTVTVLQNNTRPVVAASVSGAITCTVSAVTLSASTSTNGVTYQWSGPSSFTSTVQNPVVTVSGAYSVVVTDPANGCTSLAANVTVQENKTAPGVSIAPVSNITCTVSSVTLTASSSTTGVTYLWTRPDGSTASTASISATAPGNYTVKATNPANGCFSTASVTVIEDKVAPTISINTPETLTCTRTSVTLTATSTPSTGVTYLWTRPDASTASTASISATAPGNYTVKVTNSANGCFSTSSVTVIEDKATPTISVNTPETLTCTRTSVTLTVTSTPSAGMTYLWTRPDGSTASTASISATAPGNYTVKVTNPVNGCFATTAVTVIQSNTPPSVTASASGSLTCTVNSVTLSASSSTSGVTYQWSGPSGFTSTAQSPVVTVSGAYSVVVTSPANGCASLASSVTVQENKTAPGVTIAPVSNITCTTPSVTLTASSSTTGVTYLWTRPDGTTATTANISTTVPGNYTVKATNPSNGCFSTASVTVTEDKAAPTISVNTPEVLTCTRTSVTLTATSTPSTGVTYLWTRPNGTTATTASISATAPGAYTVKVTNSTSGCFATTSVTVIQSNILPVVTASVSGVFTCTVNSVTLSASSSTTGITYQWSGPSGFTSTAQNPVVTVSGTYSVVVTDPASGCTSLGSSVTTQENKTTPGVSVTQPSIVTCSAPSATLSASSSTSGVTYRWDGPNGFVSFEQNPSTSIAGSYTVKATNPVNGCFSTANVTVTENRAVPANVTATASGSLSCDNNVVTLNGSSSTPGVAYIWAGPSGFTSMVQNPVVATPGIYILVVLNTTNGCTTSTTVTVTGNTAIPEGVTAVASNNLTCSTPTATITGTSLTSGVAFSWTGPNGFTSSAASFTTAVSGTYTLSVSNPVNGCSTPPVSVTISESKTPPALAIANPLNTTVLTCFINPIPLNGSSTTTGATFRWTSTTGLDTNTPGISVTTPGDYTLTVTGPNGCQSSATRRITQTLTSPVASATVSGVISCGTPSVILNGGSSNTPVTYSWTGPSGFTSTLEDPTVTVPGLYTLTIVTPGGCTDNESVTVQRNVTEPTGVTASYSGSIGCMGFVLLEGNSSTPDVLYHWTGPEGFDTTEQEPVTTVAGTYTLTVTHPVSGCVITKQVIVEDNGC